jgi:4-hydroxybenzoate polyprenyltransferase
VPRVSAGRRIGGLIRLIHPFPSILDGLATAAIALLAGGDPPTALRLGGSMVALQASIGALNDLVDAGTDAGRKPGKPIPAGFISRGEARLVATIGAGMGVILAGPSGPGLITLAAAVLVVGYGYDLLAKGTAWSWVPFAIGIPLLPVFGWFGAARILPSAFLVLLPAAVAAGAALAIANARADLERDAEAGLDSVAIRLGATRARALQAALLGAVVVVAIGSLWIRTGPSTGLVATTGAGLVIAAGLAWGHGNAVDRRQRGWEVEAIGVALLAAAWLAGYGDLG